MKYSLEIGIQFESKSDAQAIMDACEPLVMQSTPETLEKVHNALVDQIQASVKNSKALVLDAIGKREQVTSTLHELQQYVSEMRDKKRQIDELLKTVQEQSEKIYRLVVEVSITSEKKIGETDKIVKSVLDNLTTFNEQVEKAKTCIEASNFLNDMINVNQNIVTGGKVTLRRWEYDKSYGKEHWIEDNHWEVNNGTQK